MAAVVIQSMSELLNVCAAGVVQHSANWALALLILKKNIEIREKGFVMKGFLFFLSQCIYILSMIVLCIAIYGSRHPCFL